MKTIKFTKNWNNKLDCRAFFTIRLKDETKYKVGEIYKIEDKNNSNVERTGVIRDITDFPIKRLKDQMSLIDMGVTADLGMKILKDLYPEVADWTDTIFSLITIEVILEMY